MEAVTRKRIVWFAVFMIWIGMVAAILIYQEVNPDQIPSNTSVKISGQSTIVPTDSSQGKPSEELSSYQKNESTKDTVVKEEVEKDFFVQYRLERDKSRSQQVNILREVINNPNSDQNLKKSAQESLLALTKDIEQEMEIESLIRAQGFKEALAYKHENSITLIIDKPGLNEADALKIGDIVTRVTTLRSEDITIIEKRITK